MQPPPLGIRDTYPRLPLPLTLRAWAAAARPFTLLAPLIGVLLAGAASSAGPWLHRDHLHLALGVLTLGLATIGGNLLNQATDLRADAVNRAYRPVPRGLITPTTAAAAGMYAWLVAMACSLTLGPTMAVLVLAIITLSYSYSAPPLRLKRIPWLGNLGVAAARGVLGWCAAWSVWAPLNPTAVLEGLALSLFLVGATTAKDFADAAGDEADGVRTLVVAYGPARAAWASLPFVLSPLLTLPLLLPVAHLRAAALVPALLGAILLARQMVTEPLAPNHTLEGSRPWVLHYLTLLLLMVAYASATPPPF